MDDYKISNSSNDAKFEKLNDQHDEEMKQMVAALNNNTMALQHLTDRLGEKV